GPDRCVDCVPTRRSSDLNGVLRFETGQVRLHDLFTAHCTFLPGGGCWVSGRRTSGTGPQDLPLSQAGHVPPVCNAVRGPASPPQDRKSTRLNSSHVKISY